MSDVDWPLVFLGVGAGAATAIAVLLAVLVMQVPRIVERILFVGGRVDTVACQLVAVRDEMVNTKHLIAEAISGASSNVGGELADARREEGLGYGGIFR